MIDAYQDHILEAAESPSLKGQLDQTDVTITSKNASCGDDVTLFLQLTGAVANPASTITAIKWQGQGCVISQAATELLAQKISQERPTVAELQTYDLSTMLNLLGLETISPGRVKCLMMSLLALQQESAHD